MFDALKFDVAIVTRTGPYTSIFASCMHQNERRALRMRLGQGSDFIGALLSTADNELEDYTPIGNPAINFAVGSDKPWAV